MLLSQFTWQGSIGKKRALHVSDGTGRGSIGKKVSSETSDLWFDSHQQTHHCYIIRHFFQEIVIENRQNKGKKEARNGPNIYKWQKFENLDTISETRSWFRYFAFSVCRKDAQQASPCNFQNDYSMNIKDVGMWNKVNWM